MRRSNTEPNLRKSFAELELKRLRRRFRGLNKTKKRRPPVRSRSTSDFIRVYEKRQKRRKEKDIIPHINRNPLRDLDGEISLDTKLRNQISKKLYSLHHDSVNKFKSHEFRTRKLEEMRILQALLASQRDTQVSNTVLGHKYLYNEQEVRKRRDSREAELTRRRRRSYGSRRLEYGFHERLYTPRPKSQIIKPKKPNTNEIFRQTLIENKSTYREKSMNKNYESPFDDLAKIKKKKKKKKVYKKAKSRIFDYESKHRKARRSGNTERDRTRKRLADFHKKNMRNRPKPVGGSPHTPRTPRRKKKIKKTKRKTKRKSISKTTVVRRKQRTPKDETGSTSEEDFQIQIPTVVVTPKASPSFSRNRRYFASSGDEDEGLVSSGTDEEMSACFIDDSSRILEEIKRLKINQIGRNEEEGETGTESS